MFVYWCFGITKKPELVFVIPATIIVLGYFIFKKSIPYMMENVVRVRIFCLIYYGFVILSLGVIESYKNPNITAIAVPLGIIVFSAIYVDYFYRTFIYKLGISAIYLLLDYLIKRNDSVGGDIAIMALALLLSSFCYYVLMTNITDRSMFMGEVEKKSRTDMLTGLLNRAAFEERSIDYLTRRRIGAKATMFKMNLDDFKKINDEYGHHMGDEVLNRFGCILREYFHPTDVVGRVGGDEFMVLVMGEMPDSFIEKRCRSILHDLKDNKVGDIKGFSCSIGVCEDSNGHTYEEMRTVAEAALEKAKSSGKACHVVMRG